MINRLKGKLSSILLGAKSNYAISHPSLIAATGLSLTIAVLSGIIAFAQWQLAEKLVSLQDEKLNANTFRLEAVPAMATLQANAHRATLSALLARDPNELEEADATRKSNLGQYEMLSKELGGGLAQNTTENLRLLTANYQDLSGQVVSLVREGRKDDALDLRAKRLRDAFDRWQQSHEAIARQLLRDDSTLSEIRNDNLMKTKRWLLALLLVPIALMAAGTVVISALLGIQRLGSKATDAWSH